MRESAFNYNYGIYLFTKYARARSIKLMAASDIRHRNPTVVIKGATSSRAGNLYARFKYHSGPARKAANRRAVNFDTRRWNNSPALTEFPLIAFSRRDRESRDVSCLRIR
jgi:hypothetical protein